MLRTFCPNYYTTGSSGELKEIKLTQNTFLWQDATFYHIYPLGLCSAPQRNDFQTTKRIEALYPWLDHMQKLGMDSLYLGPVFQSSSHGYDTIDYYQIDSRLGDNDSFARFAEEMHRRGCAWCWMLFSTTSAVIFGPSRIFRRMARVLPIRTGSISTGLGDRTPLAIRLNMRVGRGILAWLSSICLIHMSVLIYLTPLGCGWTSLALTGCAWTLRTVSILTFYVLCISTPSHAGRISGCWVR